MKLSIILPTYNERNNILPLVKNILEICKNFKEIEIIIVDDNSSDNTYEHCKKNLKDEIFKIFLRKQDRSLAKSINFGIQKSSGDKIIVMDTDHTHDPKYIPEFITLSNKFDLVIGSRFSEGGKMLSTIHHYFSYFFNIFLRILLNTNVKDNLGGYFCLNRRVLDRVELQKIFYGYGEYFFRLIFYLNKKKITIKEVGVIYNLRLKDKSKSNFFRLFFKYTFESVKLRIKNLF